MVTKLAEMTDNQKLKYPKSVFFIAVTEFCERFSYLGMRTILALYLRNKLNYTDHSSTLIYHIFMTFVYFCPLFGAIIADSVLGKYRTIFYLSIIYSLGQILISAGAVPPFGLPVKEFTMTGLVLIALGTGGIKPCVAALGGDQFILPQQQKYLESFFAVFYFSIYLGSLVSSIVTPEIRSDVKCFGDQECYAAAFFIPAVLMIISIFIFVAGKSMYVIKKPKSNVVLAVTKCISHAIYRRYKASSETKREHWLDYADDKYDHKLISDTKAALRVLLLFTPLPFFWALADQQGSRWTFQATRMDGEIGSFLLKADQVQLANPLFVLIFIPIFQKCVYPLMKKIKIIDTPLKKMAIGGFLVGFAFIASGILELKLETTYPVLPTTGTAQVQILNPRDCQLPITINNQSVLIEPFGIWSEKDIKTIRNQSIPYTVDFSQCGGEKNASGVITAFEGQAISYVLEESSFYAYKEYVNKTKSGNPAIRVLTYSKTSPSVVTKVELSGVDFVFETNGTEITTVGEFVPGKYDVKINEKVVDEIAIKLGGVYTLQILVDGNDTKIGLTVVTPANSVHVLWIIPQYIVLTIAEVVYSITGVEFAFTQAPTSMKSLLQAGWLMTMGFGNLIIVIITQAKLVDRQAFEFFIYAGVMTVAIAIFALMTKSYEYKHFKHDEDLPATDEKTIPLQEINRNGYCEEDEDETTKLYHADAEVAH